MRTSVETETLEFIRVKVIAALVSIDYLDCSSAVCSLNEALSHLDEILD